MSLSTDPEERRTDIALFRYTLILSILREPCQFSGVNVPPLFGNDAPLLFGNNAPPLFGNNAPPA